MQITLPSEEDFWIKDVRVAGEDALLIYPKNFPKWTNQNKYFRSSIWRKSDLKPISISLRKFTNIGEQPDFELINFKDNYKINFITKVDGSLLLISKFNGNLIVRTRGAADVSAQPNAWEIEIFKDKYPKLFDNTILNSENATIALEWTTKTNRIVLNETEEPSLWLIGIISHFDYSYREQSQLDLIAKDWGLLRPKTHSFSNYDEAIKWVEIQTNIEGLVLYCNRDQILKKIKTPLYLKLHRFKSEASLENTINLFCKYSYPDYNTFKDKLVKQFDYECFSLIQGFLSQVVDAYKEVLKIIEGMDSFVTGLQGLSRKEAALKILSSYGNSNRSSFVFTRLEGRVLSSENIKKLLWQVLKK